MGTQPACFFHSTLVRIDPGTQALVAAVGKDRLKRPAQHRELNMGQKKQTPGGCAASAPPGVCCFCPIHARPRIWTQADGGRLRNNELVQGAGVPTYRILEQVRASSTTLSAAMQSTGRRRSLSRPQISAWASSRTLLIKGETVCVCVCARARQEACHGA